MLVVQNNLPLVSISIPAYNHERYVQDAIQSVLDQDYPRIELVVLDDGSTDSTWVKIKEMEYVCRQRFENVIFKTRENRGRVATGREISTMRHGEIVGELASDDKYLPGAISAMVNELLKDSSVGVVVGTNIIIDSQGNRCYWDKDRNIEYDIEKAAYRTFDEFIMSYSGVNFESPAFGSYEELVKNNHIGNGQLRRKSLYDHIIPYDDRAPLEDLWMNLQIAKVSKFKYIPDATFAYRWHGANTASQQRYMNEIGWETLYRELEILEANQELSRWIRIFEKSRPCFERVLLVFKLWSGHCPCVGVVRYAHRIQFVMRIAKYEIALTPKLHLPLCLMRLVMRGLYA